MNFQSKYLLIALFSLASIISSNSSLAEIVHNDDVRIQEESPGIIFDDTDHTGSEWALRGYNESFVLFDGDFGNEVIRVLPNATNENALVVHSGGNVSLANYQFYVNRTTGQVGIGTLNPLKHIHVKAGNRPSIRLEQDNSSGFTPQTWDIRGSETSFTVFDRTNGDTQPFRISRNVRTGQLVVEPRGVGIGTSPLATLHVAGFENDSKILVEERSLTVAPRTLFELNNRGNTKFEITNRDADNSWAFTNSGTDFRISLQDSGVVEFRVNNAGDAFLEGMLTENSDINDKQDIESVDQQMLLDKILQLPISEWSYKDTPGQRHIGPMAQDFHAAFGLGASDTGIGSLDSSGVALAAIQALAKKLTKLEQRNNQLVLDNQRLDAEMKQLRADIHRLNQPKYTVAQELTVNR